MGTTPAAVLARIKVNNPAWSISKVERNGEPVKYVAVHAGGGRIKAADLGELENALSRRSGNGET